MDRFTKECCVVCRNPVDSPDSCYACEEGKATMREANEEHPYSSDPFGFLGTFAPDRDDLDDEIPF